MKKPVPLPDPDPIIRSFAAKWKVKAYDIVGRSQEWRVVHARAEAAQALRALGFNVKSLIYIFDRHHSSIYYYLGRTKRKIVIPADPDEKRPMPKLTEAQRAELIRLYENDDKPAAARLARSLGVASYYGSILKRRADDAAKPRKSRSPVVDRKWARARAAGPINPEGAET